MNFLSASAVNTNTNTNNIPSNCEVLIVGGGVAGSSAAYHLACAGVRNILVLETGSIGNGILEPVDSPEYARNKLETDNELTWCHAKRSGTAVMTQTSCIKMMVRCYACSSEEFIHHHGIEGAKQYLTLTKLGNFIYYYRVDNRFLITVQYYTIMIYIILSNCTVLHYI